MARGGYQKPPARTGPGGPGRFSKRSDALEQKETPGLESPDMQYGDVGRLREAIRTIPTGGGQGAPAPAARPQGSPSAGPGQLPEFLFNQDSARPDEPVTAGLDMGAGPGSEALMAPNPAPDIREQVLEYLYWTYANNDAAELLHRLREEKAVSGQVSPVPTPLGQRGVGPTRTQQELSE